MPTTDIELDNGEQQRASKLHRESIVIDGLLPTTYITEENYRDNLQEGGINAGNFTVASRSGFAQSTKQVQEYKQQLTAISDQFTLATTAADIRTTTKTDKTAVILGFQDTMPLAPKERMQLGDDDEFLRAFHDMGVRIIQLTYNTQNYIGAGCCERTDSGLTNFGQTLIESMNDLGVVIDLSHCGDRTTADAIECSTNPVILSHVGARSLSNIKRNKTDEHIRKTARNGGVVGVTFFPPCVKSDPETHEVQPSSVQDVLDHIDHVVEIGGIDHVGVGTDMNDKYLDDGVTPPHAAYRNFRPDHPEVYGKGPLEHYEPYPKGVHRHTKLQTLTHGLVERGYTDDEIRKILGGNFLRVFDTVWKSNKDDG